MKNKLITAVLTTTIAFSTLTIDAHAQSLTSLKRQVATYEAVALKNIEGLKKDTGQMKTFKKGSKFTIVERKYINGYDYIVTKGDYYLRFDNSAINIFKSLPGKTDYSKYKMSQSLKDELAYIGADNYYYDKYKAAAISYEKYNQLIWDDMFPDLLANTFQNQYIPGRDYFSEPTKTFDKWIEDGKPEAYGSASGCIVPSKYDFDILSKQFTSEYMYSNNRSVKGIKRGKAAFGYQTCENLGTGYGYAHKGASVGFTTTNSQKVKDIFVFPNKEYTYNQTIAKLGRPTSEKYITKGVHEYQAIYNSNPHNGFKIIVGFDQYKGNLKYMVKVDE